MARVLLRDIAKLAGVSHVAVSLALRNHPDIGKATRLRIHKIARKLGYRPDPMLRALAEYRRSSKVPHFQGTIAWINYHPEPADLEKHLQFRLYREGAEARARELGYQFAVFTPTADQMSSAKLKKVLYHRNIQALLLPPQPGHHAELDFDFSNFSAVTFGFSLKSPQLHLVTNRHFHASRLAVEKLWSQGYRRIGHVIGYDMNERTEWAHVGGYLTAPEIFSNGIKLPPFILTGAKSQRRRLLPWLRRYRPEVILTENHFIKVDLEKLGFRVPRDIALATLVADPRSREFAGIDQNGFEIGRLAVETVVGMLYRNETGVPAIPYRILVEGRWQPGRSVPRCRSNHVKIP
jgi:DNA-binding LacI/PurR family transcriptional regulator